MQSVKVSVVIPVYNAEKYLRECLDSVVNQTLKEIEIICVDDGSPDNSKSIVEEYVAKDSRVQLIQQKNSGAAVARNKGIDIAKGKYLSFLDSDDFFELDMLETAYTAAEKYNTQIVAFDSDKYETNKGVFVPSYSVKNHLMPETDVFTMADVKQDAFGLFKGWAWDKLFRTDFIRETGLKFQEQRTTNDMFFVFAALAKADSIAFVNRVLAHYRREVVSLSVTREKSWHCFYDALKELKRQLLEWNLYQRFERDYLNYCVHFSLWHLNTLKEPTHTILYNKLREEWFEEMGVINLPSSYFYSKKEYTQFQNICKYSADDNWSKKDKFVYKWVSNMENIHTAHIILKEKGIGFVLKIAKCLLIK